MKNRLHINIKRNNIFILIVCFVFVLGGIIFVSADTNPLADKDPQTVGAMIGSALKSVLQENQDSIGSPEKSPDRIVAEFYGEKVTAKELDYRAAFYQVCGSANPLKEAWESYITEKYIYSYAKEHNLLPSNDQVKEFCQNQRIQVESAPGGKEYVQSITDAMGMTPDDYWNDYKVKYEAPMQLTDSNVAIYWGKNKIEELTSEEILAPYADAYVEDNILLEKYK